MTMQKEQRDRERIWASFMGMNDDNERANDDDEMKPNKQHKNYKLSCAHVCVYAWWDTQKTYMLNFSQILH